MYSKNSNLNKSGRLGNRKGSMMILVFLMVLVMWGLGISVIYLGQIHSTLAANNVDYIQAMHFARAGLAEAKRIIFEDWLIMDNNGDGVVDRRDIPGWGTSHRSLNPAYISPVVQIASNKDNSFIKFDQGYDDQGTSDPEDDIVVIGGYKFGIIPERYVVTLLCAFRIETSGGDWNYMRVTPRINTVDPFNVPSKTVTNTSGYNMVAFTQEINPYLNVYSAIIDLNVTDPGQYDVYFLAAENYVDPATVPLEQWTIVKPDTDPSQAHTFDIAASNTHEQISTNDIHTLIVPVFSRVKAASLTEDDYEGAFEKDVYRVVATGYAGRESRTIEARIFKDTLLKYARFCEEFVHYKGYARITGLVYTGHNLLLPGDPNSGDIIFFKPVFVHGEVRPSPAAAPWNKFYSHLYEGYELIELPGTKALKIQKNLAKRRGIYIPEGAPFSDRFIDLNMFDFYTDPTNPTYKGIALPERFNGVVYVEGDAYVRGLLQGGSGLTIVAGNDLRIIGSVTSRRRDPTTENPIHIGLVAKKDIIIDFAAPKTMIIQAALLAMSGGWFVEEGTPEPWTSHPPTSEGALDDVYWDIIYDADWSDDNGNGLKDPPGVTGDSYTIYNNPPGATAPLATRYVRIDMDQRTLGASDFNTEYITYGSYCLHFEGPIISQGVGDAGVYNLGIQPGFNQVCFRQYSYSPSISYWPPPHFPVLMLRGTEISFRERKGGDKF